MCLKDCYFQSILDDCACADVRFRYNDSLPACNESDANGRFKSTFQHIDITSLLGFRLTHVFEELFNLDLFNNCIEHSGHKLDSYLIHLS